MLKVKPIIFDIQYTLSLILIKKYIISPTLVSSLYLTLLYSNKQLYI